jgi:hypothetical protein
MAFKPTKAYLDRLAQIESGNNPAAKNPKSSAKGRYQFIDGTAKQYGITAPFGTPEYEAQENAAIERFTADNYAALSSALGRDPSDAELYLAHQQGAQGAIDLLNSGGKSASDVIGDDALMFNAGAPEMTAQDFTSQWTDKWNSAYQEPASSPHKSELDSLLGQYSPADLLIVAGPQMASGFKDNQGRPLWTPEDIAYLQSLQNGNDTMVGGEGNDDWGVDDETVEFGTDDDVVKPVGDKAPKSGKVRTGFDQFMQGALPFADEASDALGVLGATAVNDPQALLTGDFKDPFFAEEVANARETTQDRLAQQQEDDPLLSIGAQIAGGVTTAAGTAGSLAATAPKTAAAIAAAAKAAPKTAAFLAGTGSGGLYGAGQGEGDASERVDDALLGAGFGGPAGVAGYKLGQAVGGAVKSAAATKPGQKIKEMLVDPIMDFVSTKSDDILTPPPGAVAPTMTAPPAPMTTMQMGGIVDDAALARLDDGKALPLTRGDRTQSPVFQRQEDIALQSGSEPMRAARAAQNEAALAPFMRGFDEDQIIDPVSLEVAAQDAIASGAGIIRGNYDELGRQTAEAYKMADEANAAIPAGAYAALSDRLKEVYAVNLGRAGKFSQFENAISELDDITRDYQKKVADGQSITSTIQDLEKWKKTSLNTIDAMKAEPKNASGILKEANAAYEGFLDELVTDGWLEGDAGAVDAFRKARGLATQKFRFAETDRLVEDLLENRTMTNDKLLNSVLGATQLRGKGDDGRIVQKFLTLAGERAPEMQQNLRKAVMARMLSGAVSPGAEGKAGVQFGNMRKNIGQLLKQREMMGALFDETEQKYWKAMYDDLGLIATKSKAGTNPSGTGAWAADFATTLGNIVNNPVLRATPVTGAITNKIDEALQDYGASVITGNAEKGLKEFEDILAGQLTELNGKPVFYGFTGGAAPGMINDVFGSEPMRVRVNYDPQYVE